MTPAPIDAYATGAREFVVRQRFSPLAQRYEVNDVDLEGAVGPLLAFVERRPLRFPKQVDFFASAAKSQVLFSMRARQRVDLRTRCAVLDADGTEIAALEKSPIVSLLRSTWRLHYGAVEAKGHERGVFGAIVRRVSNFPVPVHFDFYRGPDLAMSVHREPRVRDLYRVLVFDEGMPFAAAACMSVALDSFQAR
jgi:hypothetical protein